MLHWLIGTLAAERNTHDGTVHVCACVWIGCLLDSDRREGEIANVVLSETETAV